MSGEQFDTSPKKGRGRAKRTLDLIEAMARITEEANPITVRGVAYKLFTLGLIPSMEKKETNRVSRLLTEAREEGTIDWEYIVDETRELERRAQWDDPEAYARAVARSYRRDFWNQQPQRVEIWSEKGTVRGVLAPVLHEYGVGFRVMHGFGSSTIVHDIASSSDDQDLVALYVGDHDPSGRYMSDVDLPQRLEEYDGFHVEVQRIALNREHLDGLPSFPVKRGANGKDADPRARWYRTRFGGLCWELDAMDPNTLRDIVRDEIVALIEPISWARCDQVNRAEQESLRHVLDQWGSSGGDKGRI